jgi:hypothetical protein
MPNAEAAKTVDPSTSDEDTISIQLALVPMHWKGAETYFIDADTSIPAPALSGPPCAVWIEVMAWWFRERRSGAEILAVFGAN